MPNNNRNRNSKKGQEAEDRTGSMKKRAGKQLPEHPKSRELESVAVAKTERAKNVKPRP